MVPFFVNMVEMWWTIADTVAKTIGVCRFSTVSGALYWAVSIKVEKQDPQGAFRISIIARKSPSCFQQAGKSLRWAELSATLVRRFFLSSKGFIIVVPVPRAQKLLGRV